MNSTLDIVYVDVNVLLVLIVTPAVPVLGLHAILDVRSSGLSSTAVTVHVKAASLPLITVLLVTTTIGV